MTKKQNMQKLKKQLLLLSLYGNVALVGLTGCSKTAECDIEKNHIHQYQNNKGLKKYIYGEKETKGDFNRTNDYTTDPNIINNISNKNLCVVTDNINYINQVISNNQAKREAYILDYVYGPYYTYDYGFNPATSEYEYYYGIFYGYHLENVWEEVSLDEYISDKVRDYSYEFKFYKIDENGNLISKNFETLEDVKDGYEYFDDNDFVQEFVSDPYFLNKEDFKTKKLKK